MDAEPEAAIVRVDLKMLNPDDTPALRLAPYNKRMNGHSKDAAGWPGIADFKESIVAAPVSLCGPDY